MAVTWKTPKTDWSSTSTFEPKDFNRIKNNINYVNEHLTTPISLTNMGNDVMYDGEPWNPIYFNAIEDNLHNLNNAFVNTMSKVANDIGAKKTFYANGAFINYTELNRIESALLNIKTQQEIIRANKKRLPFRMGKYKAFI